MIAPPKKILGITVSPAIHDFPFFTLLFLILLVRVIAAVSRQDMIWPDEHFQTLEPAYGIIHGFWHKAWEWNDGFRSWIPPLTFVPLFWVMKLFGVTGGTGLVIAARLQCALISLLIPFGLNRLAKQAGWSSFARYGMLIAFLAHGVMALWAVAPLTDSLATALLWGFFPFGWEALERRKGYLAGVLVSLPFLLRPHFGLYALVFGAGVVLLARHRKQTLPVLLGGLSVGAVYGVVDWISWGIPFQSLLQQLGKGVKISEIYGVEPWYSYFTRVADDQGAFWLALFTFFTALALLRRRFLSGNSNLSIWTSAIPWLLCGGIVFFFAHSALAHKETRFVLPVFPLFFIALALGLESVASLMRKVDRAVLKKWAYTSVLLGFVMSLATVIVRPVYLTSVDVTPLYGRIYDEEKIGKGPLEACILLINQNWSWSRGALGIGRPYLGVDRSIAELRSDDFHCGWVITESNILEQVRAKASQRVRELSVVEKLPNGFVLLR